MKYMEVSVYGENQFTKEDVKENLEFWFQLNLKRVIAKLNNQKIKEVMEMANALLEEIEREKNP